MKDIDSSEMIGQHGFVYRNLNAGRALGSVIYSVRAKGIVRLHSPYVQIDDVKFRSAQGNSTSYGWAGVRKSGKKNVHAGISGLISSISADHDALSLLDMQDWQVIGYDPRRDQCFMLLDKISREPVSPVSSANCAICWSELRDGRDASLVIALGAN